MNSHVANPPLSVPPRTRLTELQAAGVFIAVVLATVFAIGGIIVAASIPINSPLYFVLYGIGLLTPFASALLFFYLTRASLAPVVDMFRPVRLSRGYWVVLLIPASLLAGYAVAAAFGYPVEISAAPPAYVGILLFLGWSSVMWAEEVGWRGTLLPVLQNYYGPLAATVAVAVTWSLWHVPLLFIIGMGLSGFAFFFLQALGLSLAMTWAYNRSQSVLVAILAHGAFNGAAMWMMTAVPSKPDNDLIYVQALGPFVLGMGILLLTRGRLGAPSRHAAAT